MSAGDGEIAAGVVQFQAASCCRARRPGGRRAACLSSDCPAVSHPGRRYAARHPDDIRYTCGFDPRRRAPRDQRHGYGIDERSRSMPVRGSSAADVAQAVVNRSTATASDRPTSSIDCECAGLAIAALSSLCHRGGVVATSPTAGGTSRDRGSSPAGRSCCHHHAERFQFPGAPAATRRVRQTSSAPAPADAGGLDVLGEIDRLGPMGGERPFQIETISGS